MNALALISRRTDMPGIAAVQASPKPVAALHVASSTSVPGVSPASARRAASSSVRPVPAGQYGPPSRYSSLQVNQSLSSV
jgi:hypothetical protein